MRRSEPRGRESAADGAGRVSRRRLVGGITGAVAAYGLGAASWALTGDTVTRRLGGEGTPFVPDAPEGAVRLERIRSKARGREVGLFTAVPAGHGDGAGLPVCLVMHGASATTADFRGFGLPRFLSAAVAAGARPFVLAGVDGGRIRWERSGADDPQAMLREEVPGWLRERGFDPARPVLWGWSMGGYGALRLAASAPSSYRAVAAFSPAVARSDALMRDAPALRGVPLGVWCGSDDALLGEVRALVAALTRPPQVLDISPGGHTRSYWNAHTLTAFAFLASHLA